MDTEVFHALIKKYTEASDLEELHKIILKKCKGTFSIAIAIPKIGKLLLSSNHGSLYYGEKNNTIMFSSEKYHLKFLKCNEIKKLNNQSKILDIPKSENFKIPIKEYKIKKSKPST